MTRKSRFSWVRGRNKSESRSERHRIYEIKPNIRICCYQWRAVRGYGLLFPLPHVFNNHVRSTQNIVRKNSQIPLCRSVENYKPSSVRQFSLSGSSMLLQYKQILSSEQRHYFNTKCISQLLFPMKSSPENTWTLERKTFAL